MTGYASGLLIAAGAHPLVHVNATLNATAFLLLIAGYVLIKRGRELAHKRVMLSAFAVSVAFLICYLIYHAMAGSTPYQGQGISRAIYFTILISHIILAAAVPPLAIATIYFGLRDARASHRKLARWTFPIWLYVSITGVVVYVMLYW